MIGDLESGNPQSLILKTIKKTLYLIDNNNYVGYYIRICNHKIIIKLQHEASKNQI